MTGHRWQRLRSYLRVPVVRSGALAVLAAGTALILTVFGIWMPGEDRRDSLQREVAAISASLAGAEARLALTDRYLELSAEVDDLNRRLAAPADHSQLVERLTALSARAGTRIIHGANSLGQPRAGVVPVIQDLTVEGGYAQVRDFLELVGQLETLTLLLSVDFSANPDGTLVRGKMRFMTLSEGGA